MKTTEQLSSSYGPGAKRLTLFLIVALSLPLIASLWTDHKARLDWEKCPLASYSAIREASSITDFFKAIEAYINDHIGFARPLNQLYRKAQFYLLGDSPIANVSVGKDGFIFLNSFDATKPMAVLEKNCKPSPIFKRHALQHARQISDGLAHYGVPITFAVIPSKPFLYPEKLPDSVPKEIREACLSNSAEKTVAGHLRANSGTQFSMYYPAEEMLKKSKNPGFSRRPTSTPTAQFHSCLAWACCRI